MRWILPASMARRLCRQRRLARPPRLIICGCKAGPRCGRAVCLSRADRRHPERAGGGGSPGRPRARRSPPPRRRPSPIELQRGIRTRWARSDAGTRPRSGRISVTGRSGRHLAGSASKATRSGGTSTRRSGPARSTGPEPARADQLASDHASPGSRRHRLRCWPRAEIAQSVEQSFKLNVAGSGQSPAPLRLPGTPCQRTRHVDEVDYLTAVSADSLLPKSTSLPIQCLQREHLIAHRSCGPR